MATRVYVCGAVGAVAVLGVAVGGAFGQSDPSNFGTVYNIGNVPAGSMFDVPTAVTGSQAGDGTFPPGQTFMSPTNLSGDTLGSDSQLNLFDGGQILTWFNAGPSDLSGSNIEVNVFGGFVDEAFTAFTGSTVNVLSGTIADSASTGIGGVFNVFGGSIGGNFNVFDTGTVNIFGGTFGNNFAANGGSTVNIFGTSFLLDGVPVSGLTLGNALTVADRDVALTGTYADGSSFEFDLTSNFVFNEDTFRPDATLTLTLVPAPGAGAVLGVAGLVAVRRRR